MSDDLIYLFTGTSEIFIKNRMNRIINNFPKLKTTIIKYDMETTSIATVLNDAITPPLLEDLKIIILRNPIFLTKSKEESSSDIKGLIKYLKNPIETTVLIIDAINRKITPTNEVFKLLNNIAVIIDYQESEEIEIKGWVIRLLASNNIEIKEDALTLFMEYLNGDQVRMEQEIEKLTNYIGPYGIITTTDIKLLVNKDLTSEIFSLISSIIAKDIARTNEIYQHIASNTKDVMGLISMISNTFKELLTTAKLLKHGYSQSDIAKFYNISPGRAYYIVKNAKTFKMNDLEKAVIQLAKLDYEIKSGKIDRQLGLQLFLLQQA